MPRRRVCAVRVQVCGRVRQGAAQVALLGACVRGLAGPDRQAARGGGHDLQVGAWLGAGFVCVRVCVSRRWLVLMRWVRSICDGATCGVVLCVAGCSFLWCGWSGCPSRCVGVVACS